MHIYVSERHPGVVGKPMHRIRKHGARRHLPAGRVLPVAAVQR